jgi:hypothetical protein
MCMQGMLVCCDVRCRYLSLCNIMPTLVQTSHVSMMDALAQVMCDV